MKVLVIAEAGVNHNGDIKTAKELIRRAALAGADFVKFQTFVAENVASVFAQKADYQKASQEGPQTQLAMLKRLELKQADHRELISCCEQNGIRFLSTPFDRESADFLGTLPMAFWKIPSGEITNYPYLVHIAKTGNDIVLSTGMCELEEIRQAMEVLRENGCGKITLLHCNTEYPTPFSDVNLSAIQTLRRAFCVDVGYSDHTLGIEIPIAAAALGATVIEKHFTLDKNMQGPDHRASLTPDELTAMVRGIRIVEQAWGDGIKAPSASEQKNIEIARKSIVAKCTIEKGDIFSEDNLTTKRPGGGISPMRWKEVLGQRAVKRFERDEGIAL